MTRRNRHQSPAAPAGADAQPAIEATETVTLPRRDGPPLRLRAIRRARTVSGPGPEPAVEISLWRRAGPQRGWAVSTVWRTVSGPPLRDAWISPDLEGAATELERRRPPGTEEGVADPLRRLMRRIDDRRLALAVEEAVGEALAHWLALGPALREPERAEAASAAPPAAR